MSDDDPSSANPDDSAGAGAAGSGGAAPAKAPARRRRMERIFTIVGIVLAAVLLLGAVPGYYLVKGYRRARWADERGIELVIKAEFDGFGVGLRASEGSLLGWRKMDAASYRQLRQPGYLDAEAGGDFWSAFYGMGTQLYHRTAGNRIQPPRSGKVINRDRRRAAEKREREQAALSARMARLIEMLGHEDFRKREAASAEILKVGKPALPFLEKAVASSDPEVSDRAERAATKIKLSLPRR